VFIKVSVEALVDKLVKKLFSRETAVALGPLRLIRVIKGCIDVILARVRVKKTNKPTKPLEISTLKRIEIL